MAAAERFRFACKGVEIFEGGFLLHPTDDDLSVGTPERKKPLGIQASAETRIESAVVIRVLTFRRNSLL
jgi:hypothetical protein